MGCYETENDDDAWRGALLEMNCGDLRSRRLKCHDDVAAYEKYIAPGVVPYMDFDGIKVFVLDGL